MLTHHSRMYCTVYPVLPSEVVIATDLNLVYFHLFKKMAVSIYGPIVIIQYAVGMFTLFLCL